MKEIVFIILILVFIPNTGRGEGEFTAPIDPDGVQRVQIVGFEYGFRPGHIIVKVNRPVEIKLMKESGFIPHSFILKAPGIEIFESLSKEPRTVRFTPTKTGMYTFFCDKKFLFFKGHREKGMEGSLEVVE